MNNEFTHIHSRPGRIEVIVGCMFSGKTEGLLVQIRRAELAKQNFKLFKPRIDNRYSDNEVESHNHNKLPSVVIDKPEEIFQHIDKQTQVIGIDEAQFFDKSIVEVATKLANSGKRVILAGLDTDWKARPFEPMPELMAIAEVVSKQYAICMVCGDPATRTQRLISTEDDILLGSTDIYEARCRAHFDPSLAQKLVKTIGRHQKDQEIQHLDAHL